MSLKQKPTAHRILEISKICSCSEVLSLFFNDQLRGQGDTNFIKITRLFKQTPILTLTLSQMMKLFSTAGKVTTLCRGEQGIKSKT